MFHIPSQQNMLHTQVLTVRLFPFILAHIEEVRVC